MILQNLIVDNMRVYIQRRWISNVENKLSIALNDLRSCENCGNVFLKKMDGKITNRCPACNVWKKVVL